MRTLILLTRRVSPPWFRVWIKGLYHRGLEVHLRLVGVVMDPVMRRWRLAANGESPTLSASLVGRIPYDAIRSVDWTGDEFYAEPHIYATFNQRDHQPYEELVVCERQDGQILAPFTPRSCPTPMPSRA